MSFRMAACQMVANNNKDENLDAASHLIDEAVGLGAQMVALPEMFNLLGTNDELLAGGEPLPGPDQYIPG